VIESTSQLPATRHKATARQLPGIGS
jgi:hypothetical protein